MTFDFSLSVVDSCGDEAKRSSSVDSGLAVLLICRDEGDANADADADADAALDVVNEDIVKADDLCVANENMKIMTVL